MKTEPSVVSPQSAIIHGVRVNTVNSSVPVFGFTTTLTGGDSSVSVRHEVSGDEAYDMLRRAGNFDISDLDGRHCTVLCRNGIMEFHDFA